MTNLTPEQMLKKSEHFAEQIAIAKRKSIVVGLPKGSATRHVYGNGMTVLQVGAIHEFGAGRTPERSFLRVPFQTKDDDVRSILLKRWRDVAEGRVDAVKAMDLAGLQFREIVMDAFDTQGFGKWPALSPETVAEKGSSGVLIDTGTLRNSITWEVRDDS